LLATHIRCYLFRRTGLNSEGELLYRQEPLRLERPDDNLGAELLLILPTMVVHRIDAFSPMVGNEIRNNHGLDLMSDRVQNVPLQRDSEAVAGVRDGVWCTVCGSSFPGAEQLQAHVQYCAEQDDALDEEAKSQLPRTHRELLDEMLNQPPAGMPTKMVRQILDKRLKRERMEIVCILEGTDASTSSTVQARHSYTSYDIVWDHDFEPCTFADQESGSLVVNFAKFHNTVPESEL